MAKGRKSDKEPHDSRPVGENSMAGCGATTRAGSSCERPKGWGTDHPGEGRCKLHGGSGGRPPVHGRYSLKHRPDLEEKRARFLADPEPLNLTEEIALCRSLLENQLEAFSTDEPIMGEEAERLFGHVESIARQVEKAAKILNQTALTQAEVQFLMARLADIARKYIPDDEDRDAFFRELELAVGAH